MSRPGWSGGWPHFETYSGDLRGRCPSAHAWADRLRGMEQLSRFGPGWLGGCLVPGVGLVIANWPPGDDQGRLLMVALAAIL